MLNHNILETIISKVTPFPIYSFEYGIVDLPYVRNWYDKELDYPYGPNQRLCAPL